MSADIVPTDSVTAYVNVRAAPSSTSDIIGRLQPGQSASLVSVRARWYEIGLSPGVTGFVHRRWTTELPGDAGATTRIERVIAGGRVETHVNVRAGPTADSAIVGRLLAGESLPLVGETERWYEVGLADGTSGFVHRYWASTVTVVVASKAEAEEEPAAEPPQRDRTPLIRPAKLLEQKKSAEAFALLSALEVEWAGDTGFDYLLGLAALDSGHPGEAIFALERVVKLLPKFHGARMELARALFDIGDHSLAEKEFNKLLDDDPPEEARNIIMAFLDIIQNPPVPEDEPQSFYYLMASGGYDSNANGAADIDTFQGFELDPRSTEQDSPFVEAALGGMLMRPLPSGINLLLGADAKARVNRDADFVDNTFVSGNAALAFSKGDNQFTTGLSATWSEIDGSFNERAFALNLGWTRPLANERALRVTASAGPTEYPDALKARELDMRLLYSVTVRQPVLDGTGDFDWSFIGGRDLAKDRTTPYTNTRFGARIGGRVPVQGNDLFWGLGAMKIPYSGAPFFEIDREDTQYTTNLAIELADKPVQGWTLVPNISYVRNKSNVAIYDNERVQIGLQIRTVR